MYPFVGKIMTFCRAGHAVVEKNGYLCTILRPNNHPMPASPTFDAKALRERFNPDGSPLRRMQMCMLEMVSELDRVWLHPLGRRP